MNNDVINCIPSKTMREYLTANPIELNVLQEATIIHEYSEKRDYLPLYERLLERAKTESERLLLASYVDDLRHDESGRGFYSDATCEIYEREFHHRGFPLYPFLEICNLPVLFKKGDVIRWHGNTRYYGDLYYVGFPPLLIPEHCDFSDECYLCYSLSYPIKTEGDLIYCHEHIDVCRAERASIKKLTSMEKHNYDIIKNLLLMMKIRRFNKGWKWRLMKRLLR